eukprot:6073350-Prymnesium_polylepis.1
MDADELLALLHGRVRAQRGADGTRGPRGVWGRWGWRLWGDGVMGHGWWATGDGARVRGVARAPLPRRT